MGCGASKNQKKIDDAKDKKDKSENQKEESVSWSQFSEFSYDKSLRKIIVEYRIECEQLTKLATVLLLTLNLPDQHYNLDRRLQLFCCSHSQQQKCHYLPSRL